MKKISLFLCFAVLIATGFAQQKPIAKAVIQTPTVQCEACKNRIEQRLFKEDGIAAVKADYRKHTVSVTYYKDRTNIENIKASLASLGYDADDITAEEEAYKKLPKTCQHIAGQKPPRPVN
ncbi:MAG: heavy-metal-associated domain-containing protein [Ginsengibacter sp.]